MVDEHGIGFVFSSIFHSEIKENDDSFFQTLDSILAHKIVSHLTPGGALMHGTTAQALSRTLFFDRENEKTMMKQIFLLSFSFAELVPREIQEDMQTIYITLGELLRHFWSSFPPSSPKIEEKVSFLFRTMMKSFIRIFRSSNDLDSSRL